MQEIRTEIEIEANPEQVWRLLTDFAGFSRWNPFIRWAAGEAREGQPLEMYQRAPDGDGAVLWPTVLKVEPLRELRWAEHGGRPGLYDGEHIVTLEPAGPGRVRLIQRQRFGGTLAPLLARALEADARQGLEAMNRALKEQAETNYP